MVSDMATEGKRWPKMVFSYIFFVFSFSTKQSAVSGQRNDIFLIFRLLAHYKTRISTLISFILIFKSPLT